MPRGWTWDETLFAGTAPYYMRGRLPYPAGVPDALAQAMGLDGRGRLLDVGCGPGTIALAWAHLFEEVIGLDPDAGMLAEAERRRQDLGAGNVRWLQARAEELPAGLGPFRVAAFAQSFHWMDRDRVAVLIMEALEPGGAFVHVSNTLEAQAEGPPLPYPPPPAEAMVELVQRYLGPVRRAGQGFLRYGTPGGEAEVLARAGYEPPQIVPVPGGEPLVRTLEDIVAATFSNSGSAPHLFGDRLPAFEADLRALLAEASPSGLFFERVPDMELRIWRKP